MPCRHADSNDGDVDRENFAKTALVLGGPRAIRTAIDREGAPELPASGGDPPERSQHDWTRSSGGCPAHGGSGGSPERSDGAGRPDGPDGEGETGDRHDGSPGRTGDAEGGCPVDHGGDGATDHRGGDAEGDAGTESDPPSPRYHLLLSLPFDGRPTEPEQEAVETALSSLADEFGWGPSGIVATVGYAPAYFARFEEPLPPGVRRESAFDTAVAADGGTPSGAVALHLASDDARLLLAAEEALWDGDPVLDADLGATLSGTFERPREPPERRAMVATGDGVTPDETRGIDSGPFAGGAIRRVRRVEDGNETGGCPAHGGASAETADLVGLDPSDPVSLSVSFDGPETESAADEAVLVPPVPSRALPAPGGDSSS